MNCCAINLAPRRRRPSALFVAGLVGFLLLCGLSTQAQAAEASQPIPPELVDAIKGLKTADAAGRQKTYDLLAIKGDARLIPALKAYKDGGLLLNNDKLMIYGERVTIPDKGSVVPLIDAISAQPIPDAEGKPTYVTRLDLSKAIKGPPRSERGAVNDLIASLSLLDPDPIARTASIRDAAERAARALPDPADTSRLVEALNKCSAVLTAHLTQTPAGPEATALRDAVAAIAAGTAGHEPFVMPDAAGATIKTSLLKAKSAAADLPDKTVADGLTTAVAAASSFQDRGEQKKKLLDELPKTRAALNRQLDKDPSGPFATPLREAIASIDLVVGDAAAQKAAAAVLGHMGTSRAANLLSKVVDAADRNKNIELHTAAADALSSANRYQTEVHVIQNTFAGLSLGSILILLALGLSIIFGLMGVINMAQGEFMMVGAFTTYVITLGCNRFCPGLYSYYLIAAVPAAFIVSGAVGFATEWLVIRHLYGRPLETLLATWGVGRILIWVARRVFSDNVTFSPPRWMEGGWEVAPDIIFPLNRVYIILFCAICIAIVYFVVNGTKLGLLLRATTQNREMAAALGVPTRLVDGMTFAFGAGLAGLAGVAVPLYDKINPEMGQSYIVDCFMVVVVGGVGKVAGAIWAGLGLGFIGKYLEALLGTIPSMASGSSVIGKVLVLALIIMFLQKRPQGLFPPKGRNADA